MRTMFASFISTMAVTAFLLAGLGWATATYVFVPPQQRYQAGGYSFVLPTGWSCAQDGTETVCKPESGPLERRALIVAAAKVIGPNDNYEFFRTYLQGPRSIAGQKGGPPLQTENRFLREMKIGETLWLESLQLNGELPNYFTHYWVAKESALSVLVTYSVHKDQHDSAASNIALFGQTLEARKLN